VKRIDALELIGFPNGTENAKGFAAAESAEAARLMIGGFIEKGMIKDEGELRFLEQRLQELERKAAVAK